MKNDRNIRTYTDSKRDPRNIARERDRRNARRAKHAMQGR